MSDREESILPVDTVIQGDCVEVLAGFPDGCIDLIFADPPYNLQLRQALYRPNMTQVDAVTDEWDQFGSFAEYDAFTRAWLTACRRVLKRSGTLWVIGTYHNIFRVGAILQDLGFWILNDIVWVKSNPMPNFQGVRFTNAHETLIWAARDKESRYTFNHHALKAYNGGKQMRSDWHLPVCGGAERIRVDGEKAHSTQKPEALLERVITAASSPGDLVLDPFLGSGTTAAVAKRLRRRWIGIEREQAYVEIARARIASVEALPEGEVSVHPRDRARGERGPAFAEVVAAGLLKPGEVLYFQKRPEARGEITTDGAVRVGAFIGSIHMAARQYTGGRPCNGWEHWFYRASDGSLRAIDALRKALVERSV